MIYTFSILCLLICSALSVPFDENDVEAVEPEYLDQLLEEKRYEEFNRLMGIDVPHLSKPRENESGDPRFSKHLEHGDMLLRPWQKVEARQAINFTKYPVMKWDPVYYTISSNYTASEKKMIEQAISQFNSVIGCLLWKLRISEPDYVFFFPGQGCYSNLGRVGKQQPLSLQKNGCMYTGTILHEMKHAIGFVHEQCRPDRDAFIKVLPENIKPEWISQYDKVSSKDFVTQNPYDYYSIMHYPQCHPDVSDNKKAFDVLDPSIDPKRIGTAQKFTDTDVLKIKKFCCKSSK